MICERYSCKMSEMACFIRRRNALSQSPATYNKPGSGDTGCKDCEQGTAIAARTNPDQANAYSAELREVMANGVAAVAAKKRGRPKKQSTPPVKENEATPMILREGHHPEPPKVRPVGPPPAPQPKANVNHSFPSLTLTDRKQDTDVHILLDMTDYPKLLEDLKTEARLQFRTVENQILYFLHTLAVIDQ